MIITIILLIIGCLATAGLYVGLRLYSSWIWFWVIPVGIVAFFLAAFALYIIALVVIGLFFDKKKERKKPNYAILWMVEQTTWLIDFLLNVKVHDGGLNDKLPKGPFLLISNHLSDFDQITVLSKIKSRQHKIICISKPENMNFPIAGPWIQKAGYLPINRENAMEAVKTIVKASTWAEQGLASVYICPEGTRSKDHHIHEYKPGSLKVATRVGLPIVVLAIRGSYQVGKNLFKRRTHVYVDLLEIIPGEETKGASTIDLCNRCYNETYEFLKSKGAE